LYVCINCKCTLCHNACVQRVHFRTERAGSLLYALQLNILKVQRVQRGASAFAAAAAGCRRSIDFRLKVTLNTVAGPFTFAGRLSALARSAQPPTFPKPVGCNPSCSAAPPPPLQRAAAFSALSLAMRFCLWLPACAGSFSFLFPFCRLGKGEDGNKCIAF
jgi:hypothetical protein